jgi:di/tripeptidase
VIDNNVIISICGFVTTITVTVLNQRASARKSKEDREEKALEVQAQLAISAKLAELKAEKMFREQSEELTHKLTHAKEAIQEDLERNTQLSVKAFEEANHANEKITAVLDIRGVVEESSIEIKTIAIDNNRLIREHVAEQTDSIQQLEEKAAQQRSIKATVEDTNRVVHEFHDDVIE